MSENGTWPVRFCAACGADSPQDSLGCRTCRHRAAQRSDEISARRQRIVLITMLALSVLVPLAIYVVGKLTEWKPPRDDEATNAQHSEEAPPPQRPAPAPAAPKPAPPPPDPTIIAATPKARAVAEAVVSWCGYDGNAAFWRTGYSVESVDIGNGEFNVIVDHERKAALLNGYTLWYLAKTKRGKLVTVTPNMKVSADACRGLDATPLEPGVAARVR